MTSETKSTTEPRPLKILVMDDEEIVRTVLRHMLIRFGYDVILSTNGEEAISIHQQYLDSGETIDLFIMDLTVPCGMGGLEAIVPLRNQNPNIRVIATSGNSINSILCNYAEHGFSGSIAKPFEMASIRKAIEKAMAS